jgi:hypothetical protein
MSRLQQQRCVCDLARIESCGGQLTVGAVVRERSAKRSADVTKSVPLLVRVVLTGWPRPRSRPPPRRRR